MKRFSAILTAVTLLTLIGCNQPVQQRPAIASTDDKSSGASAENELSRDVFPIESSTNTVKLNGWEVSYPRSYKQLGMTMTDGVLKIQFEKFTFEVRDNVIRVDNQEFGSVSKGDVLLIGVDGQIAVNGEARQPIVND